MSDCPVISILLSRQDADFHAATAMALETCLLKRPARVILKLFGEGIPITAALAYDDILQFRFPETTVISMSYGRLIGPDLLVWLRGDYRQMVASGYGYIPLLEDREDEGFGRVLVKTAQFETLARRDYGVVLRRISKFLPVQDFTGVIIDRPRFAEFGLLGPRGQECGPGVREITL